MFDQAHRERKRELQTRVNAAQQSLAEATTLFAEQESRLKPLQKDHKEALGAHQAYIDKNPNIMRSPERQVLVERLTRASKAYDEANLDTKKARKLLAQGRARHAEAMEQWLQFGRVEEVGKAPVRLDESLTHAAQLLLTLGAANLVASGNFLFRAETLNPEPYLLRDAIVGSFLAIVLGLVCLVLNLVGFAIDTYRLRTASPDEATQSWSWTHEKAIMLAKGILLFVALSCIVFGWICLGRITWAIYDARWGS